MDQKPSKAALRYASLIILFTAFMSELVGMLILHHTQSPHNNLVLFDSFLIVILLIPALYLFAYRPLDHYVKKINRLDAEKDEVITKLKVAITEIKTLRGIIPICASCKKIRDDEGYWRQIESYIRDNSEAEFSHGICPVCAQKLYPEFYAHEKKE